MKLTHPEVGWIRTGGETALAQGADPRRRVTVGSTAPGFLAPLAIVGCRANLREAGPAFGAAKITHRYIIPNVLSGRKGGLSLLGLSLTSLGHLPGG